jgi:hypothetical protein
VAEALRDRFDREGQAELDSALQADREESIRVAEAFLPFTAPLLGQADW